MQSKLRNWIMGGAALLCMTSSLFAGSKPGGYDDHEKRLRALEHHARKTSYNAEGRYGSMNPSARGCPIEWGFMAGLDFLYWGAQNKGFNYAYDQFEGFGTAVAGTSLGNYLRIDQDWWPGFRIAAGFNSNHDWWDVLLNWTYYHNRSTESPSRAQKFPGNTGDGLHPVWPATAVNATNGFEEAFGLWRLNLNTLDLELGKSYYISRALTFRPQWGIRAGWLYQDFETRFRDPFDPSTRNQNFRGEDNYWGVGPRAGVRTDWLLGSGVSIFGNAAATMLYGRTYTYYLFEVDQPAGSLTFQAFNRSKDDFAQLVPSLQLQLGFDWGMCFDNWFFFSLSAAWETNYWWNRMNLPVNFGGQAAGATTTAGTLINHPVTMEGVTFSTKLDF